MRSFPFVIFVFFLLVSSCYRVSDKIEPKVSYAVQERYLKTRPSPFTPLSEKEKSEDWGKEYTIGMGFARQLELYQAITSFKRAEFLIPQEKTGRREEIQYEILLCYFLGKKYGDVIYTFEKSDLRAVNSTFSAYHDLLIMLYESYQETKDPEKAERVLELIEEIDPPTAEKLKLSSSMVRGDLPELKQASEKEVFLKPLLASYEKEKKSVGKAQAMNALIPGTGYLYLGQKKSALTAFLLNGLFIAAAVHSFQHKHVAAGIILTSFEAGWYFGGIYGAGEEAKYYNERLYEKQVTPVMNQKGLFPVFMLRYGF